MVILSDGGRLDWLERERLCSVAHNDNPRTVGNGRSLSN
jgi:hypothetical protein